MDSVTEQSQSRVIKKTDSSKGSFNRSEEECKQKKEKSFGVTESGLGVE